MNHHGSGLDVALFVSDPCLSATLSPPVMFMLLTYQTKPASASELMATSNLWTCSDGMKSYYVCWISQRAAVVMTTQPVNPKPCALLSL